MEHQEKMFRTSGRTFPDTSVLNNNLTSPAPTMPDGFISHIQVGKAHRKRLESREKKFVR